MGWGRGGAGSWGNIWAGGGREREGAGVIYGLGSPGRWVDKLRWGNA